MLVSIVIPCFNNEKELENTIRCINTILRTNISDGFSFELVLIDDNSSDDTWGLIRSIKQAGGIQIQGVRLTKNVGAYTAILAGFECATGEAILVMAADGDDPPEFIPQLLKAYSENIDLVQANRETSQKSPFSLFTGKLFIGCLKLLGATNIPSSGCDFVLISKLLVNRASENGWKPGNTLIQIFQYAKNVTVIGYKKGHSKPSTWTFTKKAKLFLDTIGQFSNWYPSSKTPKWEIKEKL